MTLLTLVSGWFGVTFPSTAADSNTLRVEEHYEEAEYDDGNEADESADASSDSSDEEELAPDSYFRPSRLFAASYEEEAAHLREAEELALDADEILLES